MNGHPEERSPSSSLLTMMRRFLPEFDPETGPKDPGGASEDEDGGGVRLSPALSRDISRAWQLYLQTFNDLCHVEKVRGNVSLEHPPKTQLTTLTGDGRTPEAEAAPAPGR